MYVNGTEVALGHVSIGNVRLRINPGRLQAKAGKILGN
jgi:hypothetical protein